MIFGEGMGVKMMVALVLSFGVAMSLIYAGEDITSTSWEVKVLGTFFGTYGLLSVVI
jgi:hypothetical protein